MVEPQVLSLENIVNESENPRSRWRGVPFWALNGKLTPPEIRRQIRGFAKCGMGGFFLHPRTGLQTPYLSEEFMDCIASAVEEAENLGLKAWLYDEDRFPSGFGGGMVTCDPRFRAKGIFMDECQADEAASYTLPETFLAAFAARITGDTAEAVRRLSRENFRNISPGESLLVFYTDTIKCSSWYNGFTYLDTINEEAVQKFIDVTHEKYRARFGEKFGGVIPGIFTDEPRFGFLINQPSWDVEKRYALPWSSGVLEKFRETYHYDPVDHLPEYFFKVKGVDSTAPRVHYVEILTQLFLKAFAGKIGQWCRNNGMQFTGHVVAEDSLSYQTIAVGSAMRFYEYMDMPGIDLLTEHHRAFQSAKQLSSAAHQFGKERRLSETYGCTGWDFPILGFKALGDWLYALGVNYRCQHLAFYTMEGEAKRDYPCPVALHSNSPDDYRAMEDYFARLSLWLSQGEECRSILVISPIESAWSLFHRNWRSEPETMAFDREFVALSNELLANQLDFDYADEDILARYGKCVNGTLTVGKAAYEAVIIPRMLTIRQSTIDCLQEFCQSGGCVIAVGDVPEHVDGWQQKADFSAFEQVELSSQLPGKLEKFRQVSLKSENGDRVSALLHQLRRHPEFETLFICNTGMDIHASEDEDGAHYRQPFVFDRKMVYDQLTVELNSALSGEAVEFDPKSGRYLKCDSVYEKGRWIIKTSFDRLDSRLFIITAQPGVIEAEAVEEKEALAGEVFAVEPEKWQITMSELNVALFDHFASDVITEKQYVLSLDSALRNHFFMPERDGLMVQPWCRNIDLSQRGRVEIFTEFTCEYVPRGPLFLVLERPELYRCFINEEEIPLCDIGCWHEAAWRKVPILKSCLKKGKNILKLSTELDNSHPGLESLFLLGDFAVREENGNIVISHLQKSLFPGDWAGQGLTFYAGNLSYSANVVLPRAMRGKIRIGEFYGTPAVVKVNGCEVARLFCAPGETKVVDLPEKFQLEITVTGSMRNACGPFFQPLKQPVWCGPYQFKAVDYEERQLMPYGIFSKVEIIG